MVVNRVQNNQTISTIQTHFFTMQQQTTLLPSSPTNNKTKVTMNHLLLTSNCNRPSTAPIQNHGRSNPFCDSMYKSQFLDDDAIEVSQTLFDTLMF